MLFSFFKILTSSHAANQIAKLKPLLLTMASSLMATPVVYQSKQAESSEAMTLDSEKSPIAPVPPEMVDFYYRTPSMQNESYQEILTQIRIAGHKLGKCLEKHEQPPQNLSSRFNNCHFQEDRLIGFLKKVNGTHPSDPEVKLAQMSVEVGRTIHKNHDVYNRSVKPNNGDEQIMNLQALKYEQQIYTTRASALETLAWRERVNQKPDRHLQEYHREISPDEDDYDLEEYWLQASSRL